MGQIVNIVCPRDIFSVRGSGYVMCNEQTDKYLSFHIILPMPRSSMHSGMAKFGGPQIIFVTLVMMGSRNLVWYPNIKSL